MKKNIYSSLLSIIIFSISIFGQNLTPQRILNQGKKVLSPIVNGRDGYLSPKYPIYLTYIKPDNELVPSKIFPKTITRYFSFIAGGQDVTSVAVNNFSIDLLDAKFNFTGSTYLFRKKIFVNTSLSGDKEGNTATLFKDRKTGGNFEGELKISIPFKPKFYFTAKEKKRLWDEIDGIDKKYFSEYLRLRYCPPKHPKDTCKQVAKFLDSISVDSTKLKLQNIIDSAEVYRLKAFETAKWSGIRMWWATGKFKLGGDKVYSINNTFNYLTDTVLTNNLITGYAGLEINYYFHSERNNFTIYSNAGLGYERSNNIDEFDKTTVTESVGMIDSTIDYPNSQNRTITDKYEAYKGIIKPTDYLMGYLNLFSLFGKSQIFGLHFGLEGRLNLNSLSTQNSHKLGITVGVIGNIPKKDDKKSLITVEFFLKLNQVNLPKRIDFNNERNAMVGLTFNVPIPSLPK